MVWYDDKVINEIYKERIELYGRTRECVLPEKELSTMTLRELRKYATFFIELDYDSYHGEYSGLYKIISYGEKKDITEKLNKEFNQRAGDEFVKLYDYLDKIHNREKWNGEQRFHLMTLTNRKGHTPLQICKGILEILKIKKSNVDNIIKMLELSRTLVLGDFGFERGSYDIDDSREEGQKLLNERRKAEIDAQDSFIDRILGGKDEEN